MSEINRLAKQYNAKAVLHVGDFGFYDETSFQRLNFRELSDLVRFSGVLTHAEKGALLRLPEYSIRSSVKSKPGMISEFMEYTSGRQRFNVPVYVVHGNQEDVSVLLKVHSKQYSVPNLHLVTPRDSPVITLRADEANPNSPPLHVRILGLGGNVTYSKLFDIGEGREMFAGGHGEMWATIVQAGELLDTAARAYSGSEVRLFASQGSPMQNGLLNAVARACKADFSFSGGLHSRHTAVLSDWFATRSALAAHDNAGEGSPLPPCPWWQLLNDARQAIPRLVSEAFSRAETASGVSPKTRTLVARVLDCLDNAVPGELASMQAFSNAQLNEGRLDYLCTPLHVHIADAKYGHVLLTPQQGHLTMETVSRVMGLRDLLGLDPTGAHARGPSSPITTAAPPWTTSPTP